MRITHKSKDNVFRKIKEENIHKKENPFGRTYSVETSLSTVYGWGAPVNMIENDFRKVTVYENNKILIGWFIPEAQPTEEDLRLKSLTTLEILFLTRSQRPVQSNYEIIKESKKNDQN